MRIAVWFVLTGIWTCSLAACARTPRPLAQAPVAPARTPVAVATPSPSAAPPGPIVAMADARFTVTTLPVESATIAAADLNGDGHQDLVVGGQPEIVIYLGDGTGRLTPATRAPGGEEPNDFALADLDGDGHLDIAVANHDTDYLTVLLGGGDGGFLPAIWSPIRLIVRPHPHVVRAADLDGDGHVDLVVDDRDGEGVLVLRGLGGGPLATPGISVPVGGDPYLGLALGDLNGDGRLDLVTPNPDHAGVLLGAVGAEIAFVPAAPVPATAPFAVALGHFDDDEHLDLLTAADEGSALVELFLGDGRGGFAPAADSPFRFVPGGKNIVVGDFNGDGSDDAVVSSYHAREVLVLLGGPAAMKVGPLAGGEHPWGLAAADFNEDGRDDLVVVDDGAGRATLYLSVE